MIVQNGCTVTSIETYVPRITIKMILNSWKTWWQPLFCRTVMIFLLSFFYVMVHWSFILLEKPVFAVRYDVDGYTYLKDMFKLKTYIRSKSPEWRIVEGYLAEECVIFCSRYLSGVKTQENRAVGMKTTRALKPTYPRDLVHLDERWEHYHSMPRSR